MNYTSPSTSQESIRELSSDEIMEVNGGILFLLPALPAFTSGMATGAAYGAIVGAAAGLVYNWAS